MTDPVAALRASTDRLADLARPLGDGVRQQAYPTEWTIADVMSHLGSGATIFLGRAEDSLAGRDTPDGFNESVWDEWNAKDPESQAVDALAVDEQLTAFLEAMPAEDRARLIMPLGPMKLEFDRIVGMRLNEHVVHVWDIEVALRPEATLPPVSTAAVVDNVAMIAGRTGRSPGDGRTLTVATADPARRFAVTFGAERLSFEPDDGEGDATVTMPAEALVRLVYGRLDPAHTPATVTGDAAALDALRQAFPGL